MRAAGIMSTPAGAETPKVREWRSPRNCLTQCGWMDVCSGAEMVFQRLLEFDGLFEELLCWAGSFPFVEDELVEIVAGEQLGIGELGPEHPLLV